ncbi:MAG TPA: flagellar hook-associated protein FlgL [Actinomycetales bacterium]|jgi:flagellar hook-associated protein 3 FlgL
MRITQQTIASSSLANLQASLARGARLQEHLTSGKVINKASDSPAGTVSVLALQSEISANEQYESNANDGKSWLAQADSKLQAVNDLLMKVNELTLQASSTGNMEPSARAAIATQVTGLRGELMQLANSSDSGRSVFAGTSATPMAFDPVTYDYQGDAGEITRRLDARTTMAVNVSGPAVFGSGGSSVFALLDRIATNARSNPSGLEADLGSLKASMASVLTNLTDVGGRTNRIEAAVLSAQDRVLSLRSTLSAVEDIDLPKTILDLQTHDTAHQAALAATAKVLSPTLMDFLR